MMSFQGKRITLVVKILTIDVEKGPAWWVRRPTLATRIVSLTAELKSGGWNLSCTKSKSAGGQNLFGVRVRYAGRSRFDFDRE